MFERQAAVHLAMGTAGAASRKLRRQVKQIETTLINEQSAFRPVK